MPTHTRRPSWIAVDWGSSNLRAWALDDQGEVLVRGSSERGMLSLSPGEYENALLEVIGDWLSGTGLVDVVICGMAGARQGWREAAYLAVPTRLEDLVQGAVSPPLSDPRLRVRLLPGLCQTAPGNFDVMRGEETQLAGLVAREPLFSGLACLPGTHAKWARLENGAVTHFTTCMTGELYRLLARESVLRQSIGEDDLADPACREAFCTAIHEILSVPGRFPTWLFGLRAADLLDADLPTGEARGARLAARLSGLTIGLELAGLDKLDGPITLIGNAALSARYAMALEALGHESRRLDGETAVLAGLELAYRALTNSGKSP
ncbi:2-dehydro-3-deoxygalactonokinase [Halomonas sp. ANAO-440]|uniref:2-dehydro-3-deoxygalactonokinase n=1 Tax=Halomonas sp. ANAO-440 TaxID=2861360 RepID=UPI001CAA5A0A|nr:2-dehydro-3-deoxygalactonokinase [Halomonas sp. ANAO-440]MBZ0332224.1 2-dehydro-3-deoxygalactonokinase [Halomonas sp. ANAO-440]